MRTDERPRYAVTCSASDSPDVAAATTDSGAIASTISQVPALVRACAGVEVAGIRALPIAPEPDVSFMVSPWSVKKGAGLASSFQTFMTMW
jgi:hypothetical protein